ncbi:MAG: hypothetical protein IKE03_10570, partial [Blautia sp.]|nr:hypothetical protein [Blautia sp.]
MNCSFFPPFEYVILERLNTRNSAYLEALHALSLAEESAVSLGHGYIGTEHLL